MAGIIFLRTAKFDDVRAFYTETIGMSVWLEQPNTPTTRTASTHPAVLTSCPQTCDPTTGSQHLGQPGIVILRHGNLLVGFHRQPEVDLDGLLTFFYKTRAEVDEMYARLRGIAAAEPRENPKYQIYHFFAVDPEGRKIEFQQFLHPVPPVTDA